MQTTKKLVLDQFCARQFEKKAGSVYISMAQDEFTALCNQAYLEDPTALKPGYAPFCKHLFIPNFLDDAVCSYVEITPENEEHLRSGYEARTEKELPVLARWFDATKV